MTERATISFDGDQFDLLSFRYDVSLNCLNGCTEDRLEVVIAAFPAQVEWLRDKPVERVRVDIPTPPAMSRVLPGQWRLLSLSCASGLELSLSFRRWADDWFRIEVDQ